MKYDYIIGIDTGVNTGYAVWNTKTKSFEKFRTTSIHRALFKVNFYFTENGDKVLVRIEDARLRSNSSPKAKAMAQGVGSVKRDAKIWEDFCKDYGINYQLVAPSKTTTKINPKDFAKFTGIKTRTSNHCRDAIMLVYKYS